MVITYVVLFYKHTLWVRINLVVFENKPEMVFRFQNCSDLIWETIVLVMEEKLLKFEAKGREFAEFLRSLEQFIQTVKVQNNFW